MLFRTKEFVELMLLMLDDFNKVSGRNDFTVFWEMTDVACYKI